MPTRKGKWQPYDALEGYKEALRRVEYEVAKVEKPLLSSDELMVLDYHVKQALESRKMVEVTYYHNGYIYRMVDVMKRIHSVERMIDIGEAKINMDDIIEVNFC